MRIPEIKLAALPDGQGWAVYRGPVRLGALFPVAGGWVTAGYCRTHWRRSKPLPTAADAAGSRWGADARAAVRRAHETSEAA